MNEPDDEVVWHGWPPQVWDGKDWKVIKAAELNVRLAELMVRLTRENERMRAMLEDVGAPRPVEDQK